MIDLRHSLMIEATEDPSFFSFYSTELDGFSGVGASVEDCLYKAKWGMEEFVEVLQEEGMPIPPPESGPAGSDSQRERISRGVDRRSRVGGPRHVRQATEIACPTTPTSSRMPARWSPRPPES